MGRRRPFRGEWIGRVEGLAAAEAKWTATSRGSGAPPSCKKVTPKLLQPTHSQSLAFMHWNGRNGVSVVREVSKKEVVLDEGQS